MTQGTPPGLLAAIPTPLRDALLAEFEGIGKSFFERRWSPAELSGGRFCEVVYTILDGHAKGNYALAPQKPANFVAACRALEGNAHVPRSFQILIPRLLPALYEIRNNRGVGHVGGDVDPNHMDAGAVVAIASWVMAELVRVFHSLPVAQAQEIVDNLVERRSPLVWDGPEGKLVLDPGLKLKDQTLLLLDSATGAVNTDDLQRACRYSNSGYFLRLLRKLQDERLLVLSADGSSARILPPGSEHVATLLAKRRAV